MEHDPHLDTVKSWKNRKCVCNFFKETRRGLDIFFSFWEILFFLFRFEEIGYIFSGPLYRKHNFPNRNRLELHSDSISHSATDSMPALGTVFENHSKKSHFKKSACDFFKRMSLRKNEIIVARSARKKWDFYDSFQTMCFLSLWISKDGQT